MASHESLPEAQRAILQLLLKQGRSYQELAGPKGDTAGIRRRAHEAVEALAPPGPDAGVDRREIADYLLGQQSASRRAATREYLEQSSAGRAWARAAAAGLRPLGGTLPDLPAEPAEVEQAFDALDRRRARQQDVRRSSQVGGRLVFAGLGLILAIGLLWAFGAFDADKKRTASVPTTTSTATTSPTQRPAGYEPLQTAALKPRRGSASKSVGVAVVARKTGTQQLSLALQAVKLRVSPRRGSAYAAWLYTSPKAAQFLGFTPLVGQDGKLQTAFQLVNDTVYREVLLTRETVKKPTTPGTIILRGSLQLVPADSGQPTQTQP
jgi:hypothetical protein